MERNADNETVAVAVSGGADSLYSLIALQERGVAVIALHGVFFTPEDPDDAAAAEAMRGRLAKACGTLGIDLHCLDLRADFERLVVRPFVQAYADGRTPNPCALCNARIKFGLLLDAARSLGAGRLATGHYASLAAQEDGKGGTAASGGPVLMQGVDSTRDQSYFLALTPPEALVRALFPLAETHKTAVLESLARRGLAVPQPGESREVCFIPGDEYRSVLPDMARRLAISLPGPGPMLLRDGRRLGTHQGLWRYTEGQRRGLGLGWNEPLHVLAKEWAGNILRLGPRVEMAVAGCRCEDVNILLPQEFWPDTVLVKTRYRERPKPARVEVKRNAKGEALLHILFENDNTAAAPGQVAAVYVPWNENSERLRLAAGGVIVKAE